ncbi:signal transduction protein Syg1 [Aspergillus sp. HF37]|nr:signal transduction protein Syg1 [Aspergillus sp. HF37]
MKFAKELDDELVPEWRAKYLDYKAGKKKLKAIDRAVHKSNRTPLNPSLRRVISENVSQPTTSNQDPPSVDSSNAESPGKTERSQATPIPRSTPTQRHERQPLQGPGSRFSTVSGAYGSIVATPPPSQHSNASDIASINLPDPALDPKADAPPGEDHDLKNGPKPPSPVVPRRGPSSNVPTNGNTGTVQDQKPPLSKKSKRSRVSGPSTMKAPEFLKRVFSHPEREPHEKPGQGSPGSDIERRENEFFLFLDHELHKIESFYETKETEATQRLQVLRQQLHIMRDRSIQELWGSKKSNRQFPDVQQPHGFGPKGAILKGTIRGRNRAGRSSDALAQLATPGIPAEDAGVIASQRDFTRRPESQNVDVPHHRSAKRKLKYALREFYRGLELIKSYAYLNRTAFRKINKKYDKVVDAQQPMRYMSENVNEAWFVQSEVVEKLITETEDLYARYFERGNRKIAVSKLRRTAKKSDDLSQNSFRSGLLLMAGILFGVQALVYAGQHLTHADSSIRLRTGYLLQVSIQ